MVQLCGLSSIHLTPRPKKCDPRPCWGPGTAGAGGVVPTQGAPARLPRGPQARSAAGGGGAGGPGQGAWLFRHCWSSACSRGAAWTSPFLSYPSFVGFSPRIVPAAGSPLIPSIS